MAKKPSRPSAREVKENAYRTLVLDGAERAFARHGFDGAKIKDVADEAGLALGTVYTLYESKNAVFDAVHTRRGSELVGHLERAISDAMSGGPAAALSAALRATADYYDAHRDYLRMHLRNGSPWALPRHDAEIEARVYEAARAPATALFATARSRGELVDEEPATCARLYVSALQVYFAAWVDDDFATPPGELCARIDAHARRAFFVSSRRRRSKAGGRQRP